MHNRHHRTIGSILYKQSDYESPASSPVEVAVTAVTDALSPLRVMQALHVEAGRVEGEAGLRRINYNSPELRPHEPT